MSNSNIIRAQQLENEAKALRRAEKKWWSEVDKRKEEVLDHFGIIDLDNCMSDTLMKEMADRYQISEEELYQYIMSDSVFNYYAKWKSRQLDY